MKVENRWYPWGYSVSSVGYEVQESLTKCNKIRSNILSVILYCKYGTVCRWCVYHLARKNSDMLINRASFQIEYLVINWLNSFLK